MRNISLSILLALSLGCGDTVPTQGNQTGGQGGQAGNDGEIYEEICNGIDDDRDGAIDEGRVSRACTTACGAGTENCTGGMWVGCDAPPVGVENCDGFDNDCDGQTDEMLERACTNDCGSGTESCVDGFWDNCTAPAPAQETCNGEDEDCDGNVDEGVLRACADVCLVGSEVCSNGAFGDCEVTGPAEELCGDDADDDCDGQIDEGCQCEEGDTRPCSADIGACTRGTTTCDGDGAWGPCLDAEGEAVPQPGELPETCNGQDDDCDGRFDEIIGDDAICGNEIGVCQTGTISCVNGEEVCEGGILPSAEVCGNELDDDCDEAVDEASEDPEICDGADNNCNGEIDEGVAGDMWEPNPNCNDSADIGTFGQDMNELRAGQLNVGDEDYYRVKVEEAGGLVPNGFDMTVTLTGSAPGITYELCTGFYRNVDVGEACGDFGEGANCQNLAPGQASVFAEQGQGDFPVRNDDNRIMIKVSSPDMVCAPYTIRIQSASR